MAKNPYIARKTQKLVIKSGVTKYANQKVYIKKDIFNITDYYYCFY